MIDPVSRDLGGFSVRRILPSLTLRSLGPFVFFDEMGPLILKTGLELEVRPHPHIGLATLTWLFEGAMMHRDSLGSVQVIHPGAVNLMTAGRGIVHSERVSQSGMTPGTPGNNAIHGAQFWLALPQALEECEPAFAHHPAHTIQGASPQERVILGEWNGVRSPVAFPDALCVDLVLEAGQRLSLPATHAERGVYLVAGALALAEGTDSAAGPVRYEAHQLLAFEAGTTPELIALEPSRLLVIGGAPLDGPRYLDWNFVFSSRERLEAAKQEWRVFDAHQGTARFPQVPGETEFIPLPE